MKTQRARSGCRCSSAKATAIEVGRLLHDELLGNRWSHSGVTAKGSQPEREHAGRDGWLVLRRGRSFRSLGIGAHVAARESQVGFNQRAECTSSWLGALNLGLVVHRQRESENGAARLMRVRPQSSAMGIDDGAADRQADSHSAGLGGVEGFEDPLAILRCDAGTRVADRDEQTLRRARFGADHQFRTSSSTPTMASIALRIRFSMTCCS